MSKITETSLTLSRNSLPGYEIQRMFGEGDHGAMYLAVNATSGKPVVIKLLTRRLTAEPRRAEQLIGHLGVLRRISGHPHIVPIVDAGQIGDQYYVISDYVPGHSLEESLAGARLNRDSLGLMISQASEALEVLHELNLIHGDIKPSNILADQNGVFKITDFAAAGTSLSDGRHSSHAGTPMYLAPEQLHAGGNIGPATDVYALAAIVYEAVTGQLPLGRFKAPAELNPTVGAELDAAIRKGLARNIEERTQTIAEFAGEIDRGLDGSGSLTLRPSKVSAERYQRRSHATPVVESVGAATTPRARALTSEVRAPKKRAKPLPVAIIAGAIAVVAIVGAVGIFLFGGGESDTGTSAAGTWRTDMIAVATEARSSGRPILVLADLKAQSDESAAAMTGLTQSPEVSAVLGGTLLLRMQGPEFEQVLFNEFGFVAYPAFVVAKARPTPGSDGREMEMQGSAFPIPVSDWGRLADALKSAGAQVRSPATPPPVRVAAATPATRESTPTIARGNSCLVAEPTKLISLSSNAGCNVCSGYLLPGGLQPQTATRYTIHSSLPKLFSSYGVLYSTQTRLPKFETIQGVPVPDAMRDQRSNGFSTIDNDFEVSLSHITRPGDGTQPRRIVVYVRNDGIAPVMLSASQIFVTDGKIESVHEMESTLARRVISGDWDSVLPPVTVAPNSGDVVGYSKQFSTFPDGPDRSANVHCMGRVRVKLSQVAGETATPSLSVYVIAIMGEDRISMNKARAELLLQQGARSAEEQVDLLAVPQQCALARATGVVKSSVWRSELVTLDGANLPPGGVSFPMALSTVSAAGCEVARQTFPAILHPAYARAEMVFNPMAEYLVTLRLVNNDSSKESAFDIRFGASAGDVGLAWQLVTGNSPPSEGAAMAAPVRTGWAGPNQLLPGLPNSRSFLTDDGGPITLGPCDSRYVTIRFIVQENSAAPFDLMVVRP